MLVNLKIDIIKTYEVKTCEETSFAKIDKSDRAVDDVFMIFKTIECGYISIETVIGENGIKLSKVTTIVIGSFVFERCEYLNIRRSR